MSNLRKIELDESITINGDKQLLVMDAVVHDLLNDILVQLKVMNSHLSLITEEESNEIYTEE